MFLGGRKRHRIYNIISFQEAHSSFIDGDICYVTDGRLRSLVQIVFRVFLDLRHIFHDSRPIHYKSFFRMLYDLIYSVLEINTVTKLVRSGALFSKLADIS